MKRLFIQMSCRLPEAENQPNQASLECSFQGEVFDPTRTALSRVSRWRPPPNWAGDLWAEEITQVAFEAALQADRDRYAGPAVEFGAFVYQRVLSRLRDYCRREWRFFLKTTPVASVLEADPDGSLQPWLEGVPSGEPGPDEATAKREMLLLVMVLPRQQRSLVVRLYWLGHTETEEAETSGVNRCTINRRKAAALEKLRNHFTEKSVSFPECQPSKLVR